MPAPNLSLKWGLYFKRDPDEETKTVDVAMKAFQAGVVTKRHAVEKIAPIFGIENIDATLDALEEERVEKETQELDRAESELAAAAKFGAVGKASAPNSVGGSPKPKPPVKGGGGRRP